VEAIQTAPSFETVWATLDRVSKKQEELTESQKETERIIKEVGKKQEETALQMKETDRRLDKQIGRLGNRIGEIVEHLVAPNLREKFEVLGLYFPRANPNSDVRDYKNNIFLEIDVMLENGDKALLVEVKTTLTTEDVKDHIKRLEKMRVYADLHGDKRVFLGAVAGVVMTPTVKDYALGQGFYVLEPSGETFTIISPVAGTKEW
jgi:hypothetical protein